MFKQLGILTTFLAFAVALGVSHNVPSEVSNLPQQSLMLAQQSKHQARTRFQKSWQQKILRQLAPSSTNKSPQPKHL